MSKDETKPRCKWCQKEPSNMAMWGGIECFECWVLRHEIQKRPELAERMLQEIKNARPQ